MILKFKNMLLLVKIIFSISLCLSIFGCVTDADTDKPEIPAIKVLLPKAGVLYEPYNEMYLLAQFDIEKVSSVTWNYSIDNGENWESVTIIAKEKEEPRKDDDPFDYDIQAWIPENDSISKKMILIKASSYDDGTINDISELIEIN